MPPRSSNTWSRCISQCHTALFPSHRRPLGHISSNLVGEEKTPPATPPSSDLLAHEPIAGATQTDGPERKSQGDAQIILPFAKKEEITNLTGRPEQVVLAGSALKEPNLLPIDDTSITNSQEIDAHRSPSPGATQTVAPLPRCCRSVEDGAGGKEGPGCRHIAQGHFILHGPLPKRRTPDLPPPPAAPPSPPTPAAT